MSDWRDLITPEVEALNDKFDAWCNSWQGPEQKHVEPEDCTNTSHTRRGGPCTDLGQCGACWSPVPVMRPPGETYGLHADDCSAPERHYGPCPGGGGGHAPGHAPGHVRGYWKGMEDEIAAARERHPS